MKYERKVRRVEITTRAHSRISLHPGQVTGFTTKLLYVLLRTFPPSPVFHLRTRLRRINPSPEDLSSVATDVAKEDSCRAPKSAVHCLRGDRPPGSQPGGMSKIKFRSFPQNSRIIPNRRAWVQARRGEKAVETVLLFCLASIHFSFTIGELQLYRW